jgi:hypothetical protein
LYVYCYPSNSISSSVVAEIKIVGKYGSTAETAASERSSKLLNSMMNLQPKVICENIITQFSENSTFLFFLSDA